MEKVQEPQAEQIDMVLTVGQFLKKARKDQGKSQEDVADHLRVFRSVIEKIEADAYAQKELTVFVRGYMRSYAKYVEAPVDQVEAFFLSMGVCEATEQVAPAQFSIKDASAKRKITKWTTFAIAATLLVLVVLWTVWHHNGNSKIILTPSANNSITTSNVTKKPGTATVGSLKLVHQTA